LQGHDHGVVAIAAMMLGMVALAAGYIPALRGIANRSDAGTAQRVRSQARSN
jgi:hypothetical protein